MIACLVAHRLFLLCSYIALLDLFYKGISPTWGLYFHNLPPKEPPLSAIILMLVCQHMNFGRGHSHIIITNTGFRGDTVRWYKMLFFLKLSTTNISISVDFARSRISGDFLFPSFLLYLLIRILQGRIFLPPSIYLFCLFV